MLVVFGAFRRKAAEYYAFKVARVCGNFRSNSADGYPRGMSSSSRGRFWLRPSGVAKFFRGEQS